MCLRFPFFDIKNCMHLPRTEVHSTSFDPVILGAVLRNFSLYIPAFKWVHFSLYNENTVTS